MSGICASDMSVSDVYENDMSVSDMSESDMSVEGGNNRGKSNSRPITMSGTHK